MARSPFAVTTISNYAGGWNTQDQPDLIADNEVADTLNLDYHLPGLVKPRPGTEKIGDQVTSLPGTCIKAFHKTSDNSDRIVWKAGGTYYWFIPGTSSTNTAISGSYDPSVSSMEVYNDLLWIYNKVDSFMSWSGTGAPTIYAGATKGNIGFIYENRSYVAGNVSFPSRLYISAAGAPQTPGTSFDVNPGDGEVITSIGISEGQLAVFKGNAGVYYITFDASGNPVRATRASAFKGTVRHQTVARFENASVFLSDDSVRFLGQLPNYPTGLRDNELSTKITPSILSIQSTFKTLAAGYYFRSRYYLAVPTSVSTYNDSVISYSRSAWNYYSNVYAAAFTELNGYLYYCDSRRGQLWRFNEDLYTDDGAAIPTRMVSKIYAIGGFALQKNLKGTNYRILCSTGTTVRASYAKELGSFNKNRSITTAAFVAQGSPATTFGIIGSYFGGPTTTFGGTYISSNDLTYLAYRWSFREKASLFQVKLEHNDRNKTWQLKQIDIIGVAQPYKDNKRDNE